MTILKRSYGQIQAQNGGDSNEGDVSLTHKHSIINHRPDERLKFYEHALEEWKRLGLHFGADSSQSFLDPDSGAATTDKSTFYSIPFP